MFTSQNVIPLHIPQPTSWVSIDIETADPPAEEIERAIARWKPPANLRNAETIEARRQESSQKIKDKGALLDGAPITCISIATASEVTVFVAAEVEHAGPPALVCGKDEAAMLGHFADWCAIHCGPDSVLVGFNLLAFDLPRLRLRFLRHGLPLPEILKPREPNQPAFDVMRMFLRYFTSENHGELFMSLSEVAARLNVDTGQKTILDGAQAPRLWAAGEYLTVALYNALDATTCAECYRKMT